MWWDNLRLEVEVEFRQPNPWVQFELFSETIRARMLADSRRWNADWLKRAGKTQRQHNAHGYACRKETIVCNAICEVCGKQFGVNAERGRRGAFRTCSKSCGGRLGSRNRRPVKPITIDGQTMTLKDHAGRRGLRYRTVLTRMERGWDVRRALGLRKE